MAICEQCGREMLESVSCTNADIIYPAGVTATPIPRGQERYAGVPDLPCHDCGAPIGGIHHPGCDMEECPLCHGQLISCGCLDDEDPDA